MADRAVRIGELEIGDGRPLAVIAGPCALESERIALEVAEAIRRLSERLEVPFIYKSSYLKDNRLSAASYAGPGIAEGLRILSKVKNEFDLPILSDVHCREEVGAAAAVLDVVQIPAFLCRQTRLLEEVARAGKPINIKKGQFMAPDDMGEIAAKAVCAGNDRILLTERGTMFGYHNLVVDMRSIRVMQDLGFPVVFDATHSVQLPGAASGSSGGQPEFVALLAKAACAAGCDALFLETHPRPEEALSDSRSMVALTDLEEMLEEILKMAAAARSGSGARGGH